MRLCLAALLGVLPGVLFASDRSAMRTALARSDQLILVTAKDWNENHGTLVLLERDADGRWHRSGDEVPVMLGRNGLAWGSGLHPQMATKREGDGRSPAGLFELDLVYGSDARAPSGHFPYQQLSDVMEGIDDPQSRLYNRLIDGSRVPPEERDWSHSEKVRRANPMFRWCVMVKHNWQQRPGFGSCIYLHIWQAAGVPTAGCTAMETSALEQLVRWLDTRKHPLLLQLPTAEVEALALSGMVTP